MWFIVLVLQRDIEHCMCSAQHIGCLYGPNTFKFNTVHHHKLILTSSQLILGKFTTENRFWFYTAWKDVIKKTGLNSALGAGKLPGVERVKGQGSGHVLTGKRHSDTSQQQDRMMRAKITLQPVYDSILWARGVCPSAKQPSRGWETGLPECKDKSHWLLSKVLPYSALARLIEEFL